MSQLIISDKYKSSNYDIRKFEISLVILHYTETKTLCDALEILTSKKKKVSCHFLLDKNGDIYNLVDVSYRAWHAGESKWKDQKDINSRSIGIEIVNSGELNKDIYTDKQITSLSLLLNELMRKFTISEILGHSDIAPLRKIDPGSHFPWQKLYYLIGFDWITDRVCDEKLSDDHFFDFLIKLKELGYNYLSLNEFNQTNSLVIDAFHRKFLPNLQKKELTFTSLNKVSDLLKKNID